MKLKSPKRSEIVEHIKVDKYVKDISKMMKPVGTGWAIFLNGIHVKPDIGNNAYFASENSAIEAICRNGKELCRKLQKDVLKSMLGVNEFDAKYTELVGYTKSWNDMSDDERHNRDVVNKIESAAYNALKTVVIPELKKQGILEIREIK